MSRISTPIKTSNGDMEKRPLKKGDIALVSFPFTDLSGEKRRPAFVVGMSADHCIALFVTSRTHGERKWHVPISASKRSGLTLPSIIRCDKIASFDVRIVQGELGKAPRHVVKQVDSKLRRLLKL